MQRVELGDRRTVDSIAASRMRSSGTRWRGLTLHELRNTTPGELPEGYLLSNAAFLMTEAPESEIYLVDEGWIRVVPTLRAVHFFAASVPYAARWDGPAAAIGVEFDDDFVAAVRGHEPRSTMQFCAHAICDDPLVVQTILALRVDLRADSPSGRMYGESIGAALVAQLLKKCSSKKARDATPRLQLPALRISRVREYIHDNLTGDLSLLRLAEVAGMGIDHLIKSFKKTTGVTPHQYVLHRRIERAQALLANDRLSITAVAMQAGFVDHSHFTKLFRRIIGMSPSAYREIARR